MKEKLKKRSLAENIYIGLAGIFLGCLLVQFLLAGMSVFDDPAKWGIHKIFVHIFGYTIPVLMIISSLIGKFFRVVYRDLAAVFLLIFLMYLTANVGWKVGWLGALHPVLGVLLIATTSAGMVKIYKNPALTVEGERRKEPSKEFGLFNWILLGAFGGFIVGILLSNIVGIISVVLFDVPMGIKFLPFYLAFLSSIIVPLWMGRRKG
ncbi:DUF5957 family protein [Sutcliffiella horikoshii]|uniref:DUF5957 family protein n=1 Tax=Sutcliffiella horikoshii TaxID=79883 RepID=UPI00203FF016|nr:DUF5957 family protein [Sutcliffiella horikoshii]MCM3618083.1 DUF5957 family protein [Sutcliffiella horikoshii]